MLRRRDVLEVIFGHTRFKYQVSGTKYQERVCASMLTSAHAMESEESGFTSLSNDSVLENSLRATFCGARGRVVVVNCPKSIREKNCRSQGERSSGTRRISVFGTRREAESLTSPSPKLFTSSGSAFAMAAWISSHAPPSHWSSARRRMSDINSSGIFSLA